MAGNKESRRKFLIKSAQTGLALTAFSAIPDVLQSRVPSQKNLGNDLDKTPFTQSPLGYDYSALEPVIDAKTMEIHYTKHAAAYSNNLKEAAAAEGIKADSSVEDI